VAQTPSARSDTGDNRRAVWLGRTGLWRHPDFLKFWAGQSVSLFGSAVTQLALPLTAVLVLDARPAQMGLLFAAQWAPWLVVGLPVGVWVDRVPRRPALIAADVGRAAVLATAPAAALLGTLGWAQLYAVAFLVGVLSVFFGAADQPLLTAPVGREHLVEGNGKLEASRSVAETAGPGVGGWLVQVLTAPVALVVDALSFLVSALLLGLIRPPEPTAGAGAGAPGWRTELIEGWRALLGSPVLRPTALATAINGFFGGVFAAVFLLYLARDLALTPATIGPVLAIGGPGGFVGALLAGRAVRTLGPGRTIVGAGLLAGFGAFLVPLASGSLAVPLVVTALGVRGAANTVYNVNAVSLRQAVTPDRLLGRVNATQRSLVSGAIPLGALAGGALGETVGLQPTLVVWALGTLLATLPLLLSPLRKVDETPAH
jgi:predicted MFS family arabinose efflux permease